MATILIVEDNLVNQKLMQAIVRSMGHREVTVSNGREAVDYVASSTVDVVLMDLMMPVMDGFEATEQIRQLAGRHDLPIIAVTANTLVGSRDRAMAAGCNAFIAKPYTKTDLVSVINDWLRGSSDTYRPASV